MLRGMGGRGHIAARMRDRGKCGVTLSLCSSDRRNVPFVGARSSSPAFDGWILCLRPVEAAVFASRLAKALAVVRRP
jgi:hypothetical protein